MYSHQVVSVLVMFTQLLMHQLRARADCGRSTSLSAGDWNLVEAPSEMLPDSVSEESKTPSPAMTPPPLSLLTAVKAGNFDDLLLFRKQFSRPTTTAY